MEKNFVEKFKNFLVKIKSFFEDPPLVVPQNFTQNLQFDNELADIISRFSEISPSLTSYLEGSNGQFCFITMEFVGTEQNMQFFKTSVSKLMQKFFFIYNFDFRFAKVIALENLISSNNHWCVDFYYSYDAYTTQNLNTWWQRYCFSEKQKLLKQDIIDSSLYQNQENKNEYKVKLGAEEQFGIHQPVYADLKSGQCHALVTGLSGSGKSVFLLYILNSILNMDIELYIADFKGTGDFAGITNNYAENDDVFDLVDSFYEEFQKIKENKLDKRIFFLFDEYASAFVHLDATNKKRANDIKNKLAEILMLGRELPGGGGSWIWMSTQRPGAELFTSGVRDNFQIKLAFGTPIKETMLMLGFTKDEVPPEYIPGRGIALCHIENKSVPIFVLKVPKIDKQKLMKHLKQKGTQAPA